MARQPAVIAALCLTAALTACSGDDEGGTEATDRADPGGAQGALRRELLDMMAADQAERTVRRGPAAADRVLRGVRGGVYRRGLSGPRHSEQS
jgi:hypothetical protein